MSLPTAASLQTLDYAFGAEPFVGICAKSTIDTTTLDFAFGAEPFVGQGGVGTGGGGGSAAATQFIIAT